MEHKRSQILFISTVIFFVVLLLRGVIENHPVPNEEEIPSYYLALQLQDSVEEPVSVYNLWPDQQDGSAFSLRNIGQIFRSFWNFPTYLWQMIAHPSDAQLRATLGDGFYLQHTDTSQLVEVTRRIGQHNEDTFSPVEMMTWQPAESFVRTASLEQTIEVAAIPQPRYINSEAPIVFFYNSHPAEHVAVGNAFWDGVWNHYSEGGFMDVKEMSHFLAAVLEEHHIPALVEDRDVRDILHAEGWGGVMSYDASRRFLLDRIHQYDSLQFFFDIHRDAVPPEVGRVEINGQSYARIMFVIGMDHPGFEENYAIAQQLTAMLEARRPGITRNVRLHTGPTVNARYNQDIAPTVQLIEVGNVDTTLEEATNSLQILGEVIAEFVLEQMNH